MPALIACPICNAANQPQATFCRACGYVLQQNQPPSTFNTATGQLLPSLLLKHRYRVLCLIGQGGMGAVYEAEDILLGNRKVALKEMRQSGLNPQEIINAADAFRQEALLLAGLQNPHLPNIYDHFSEFGRWYLVMSFIYGETLEAYLSKASNGRLLLEETLQIGIQLCTVLGYLHTQHPPIIFRDLKPANSMRTTDGHIYLIDFGIARLFKPGQARDTSAYGSMGYAAPEQYGKAQTTPQSDIFSLGVVLHQLLTGYDPSSSPFRFPPLKAPGQVFPADLITLIEQMHHLDESARPTSMLIVKQKLQGSAAVPATLTPAHPPTIPTQTPFFPPTMPANAPLLPSTVLAQTSSPLPKPVLKKSTPVRRKRRVVRRAFLVAGLTFAGLTLAYLGLETAVPYVTARNDIFTYSGHHASVAVVAWSPDSKRIASGSGYGDAIVHVWDATNGMHDVAFKGHQAKDPELNMIDAELQTISWSPNGTQIVTASRSINTFLGNIAFIWNPDNANDKIQQLQGGVHTATYSPNGKYIIANAQEESGLGNIRNITSLLDLGSQQFVGITTGDVVTGDYFNCMVWSPDNKYIAGSSNGVVKVWDVFNKKMVFTCDAGLTGEMHTVAWSPDGKYLASANDDTFVHLWDAQNGTHLFTYKGHSSVVNSVAWSPDSKYLVSGSKDGTAQVWNSSSRKSVFTYTGHSQGINSVAWSPNGKHIASAGDDQTVQVWTFP